MQATLAAFLLAMSLYPDVHKKVQAELDSVIGHQRLPDLTDYGSLPYLKAALKEAFRWHSVAPLLVPHVTSADDWYKGYFIPEGSVVLLNVWYEMPTVLWVFL